MSQDYIAILSVCTVIPSLVGTRGPSAGQCPLPSAPRSPNPSSTDTGPLTPSTGTRRGCGEESRVWVRGLTCTRNNGFYLARAREPWLFGVLCGCWVACGILHATFSGTILQTIVSARHYADGSHIAIETGYSSSSHVWHRSTRSCGIDPRGPQMDMPTFGTSLPSCRWVGSARTFCIIYWARYFWRGGAGQSYHSLSPSRKPAVCRRLQRTCASHFRRCI